MFSFCLDHGLFGFICAFIFLSVSSACSVFVSSSYPSHPRDPCSFHLVSETKRIKTIRRAISRCLGGYCVGEIMSGGYCS